MAMHAPERMEMALMVPSVTPYPFLSSSHAIMGIVKPAKATTTCPKEA